MPILDPKDLTQAVTALKNSDVVGMPTETVYGLAGKIDSPKALEKIFKIKERPFFDPLIVHVESKTQASLLTTDWSIVADKLADTFWPGPLTLILPKALHVNSLITSGLDCVGIRCPRHPVALELIRRAGAPLAAPSANRFGRTSPTIARHVVDEFPDKDLIVIDGGPCEVGIESTVLKVTTLPSKNFELAILRKGLITTELIRARLKNININFTETLDKSASPGHTEYHYMPPIPLIFCNALEKTPADLAPGKRCGILKLPDDAALAARELYSEMRELSGKNYDALIFYQRPQHSTEAWQAILDRLFRASSTRVLT